MLFEQAIRAAVLSEYHNLTVSVCVCVCMCVCMCVCVNKMVVIDQCERMIKIITRVEYCVYYINVIVPD